MVAVISQDDYRLAEPMTLRCGASSWQAIGLIEAFEGVLSWPDKAPPRPSTRVRRTTALRALVADLLRLEAKGVAGYHGMGAKDFPLPVLGFGYGVFMEVKNAMVAAGLLAFEPGYRRWSSFDNYDTGERGPLYQRGGKAARFRLTPEALTEIEAAEIALDAWGDHWSLPEPLQATISAQAVTAPLIELRATKQWRAGAKPKAEYLPFDMSSPAVAPILSDLRAHNEFMVTLGVSGVDFIGLRRIFNNGDVPDYAWDQGGRFYSLRVPGMGAAYESLSGDERRQRIKIGGQSVTEVDMSASQLRLLYALLDEEIPAGLGADLYQLNGAHRDAVKAIVTQAIGSQSMASKRWGSQAALEYRSEHKGRTLEADHPFAVAQEVTRRGHPILERLGPPGVPSALGLQFIEAEVMRRAMASLRRSGIGALPVHDSLIVPVGREGDAEAALVAAFKTQVELVTGLPARHCPSVKRKGA